MKTLIGSAFVFVVLLFSCAQYASSQTAWEPQRTWVFMVGLLEWQDSESFDSFPKENRRDVILLNLLKKRGVPAEQIVYLQDRAATTAAIKSEFSKLLSRTNPGDSLFVYYEGHGYKTADDKTYLASYDVNDGRNPGWAVTAVPDAIDRYFKGSKAIIALDNCYSGTMAKVVGAANHRVSYAVMASSSASQSSTGNWTFTEAIISAFRGDADSDENRDGVVTFGELKSKADQDMLFGEEQVAAFAFTGGFDPDTKMSNAVKGTSPLIGERVEAFSQDGWYKGYIAEAKSDKYRIHYYGYEQSDDEWVTSKSIRVPKTSSNFKIGEKVEVEWKKRWYPAHILNIKGRSHYISYDDYDTDDNEWVSSQRIRKAK